MLSSSDRKLTGTLRLSTASKRSGRAHALDTTAIVHEAYLQLVPQVTAPWRRRPWLLPAVAARLLVVVGAARDVRDAHASLRPRGFLIHGVL